MTEHEELLHELRSWLQNLGYKAPEIVEEDRISFIRRISETLDD